MTPHDKLHRHSHPWKSRCHALLLAAGLIVLLPAGASAADDVAGDWQGTYVCAQGATELTLQVEQAGGNQVTALFHFYAGAENPLVPEGCFEMSGVYDAATGRIDLGAGRWMLRPTGFVTVDLSGTVNRDGSEMTGAVAGPGCSTFSLRRVISVPRLPPLACRAGGMVAFAER
jgi:opacity protein-like surface antigen